MPTDFINSNRSVNCAWWEPQPSWWGQKPSSTQSLPGIVLLLTRWPTLIVFFTNKTFILYTQYCRDFRVMRRTESGWGLHLNPHRRTVGLKFASYPLVVTFGLICSLHCFLKRVFNSFAFPTKITKAYLDPLPISLPCIQITSSLAKGAFFCLQLLDHADVRICVVDEI